MPSTITMSYHLTHDEHHHHHGRRRSSKIIDVDQVSAQRERRRVMKKRFSSIFKPFYHHHHHHHHHDKEEQVQAVPHKGVAVRSPSPTEHPTESSDIHLHHHENHDHEQPSLEHPIQTASSSSSSSVSSTTTSSHSSEDLEIGIDRNMNAVLLDMDMDIGIDMNVVDVDELIEAGLALIELEQETTMVTLQTAEDPEEEEEEDEEMEDIVEIPNEEEEGEVVVEVDQQHLTAQPTHNDRHYQEVEETEPQVTPSSTATSRPSLPPALLQEIQHHSHLDAVVEQATGKQPPRLLPRALLDEIAHHSHLEAVVVVVESSNSNNNTKNEDQDDEAKDEADVAMVPRQQHQNTDTDLMALKERCDNLATLTELLSKKLVESTLCKKRDTVSKRHETKLYQEMIRRLEEQHRAECTRMMADRKYLEGQLRCHKVESVPPPIKSKSVRFLTQKEQQEEHEKAALIAGRKSRPRRRSFMDTLITPLERAHCHASPTSTTSSCCGSSLFSPTSFSMASTIIWQNKLMPAMLSAVARAGAGAASPTPPPPQSTKSPSSSQQP